VLVEGLDSGLLLLELRPLFGGLLREASHLLRTRRRRCLARRRRGRRLGSLWLRGLRRRRFLRRFLRVRDVGRRQRNGGDQREVAFRVQSVFLAQRAPSQDTTTRATRRLSRGRQGMSAVVAGLTVRLTWIAAEFVQRFSHCCCVVGVPQKQPTGL